MDKTFISATDHVASANSADRADHSAHVADTSTAGIELRGLVVGYGSGSSARRLNRAATQQAPCGMLTCLIGPNGVGKSTLLRTIAGFCEPLDGTVGVCGSDVAAMSPRERAGQMAVVLTDRPAVACTTVEEMVAYGRAPYTGFLGRLTAADRAVVDRSMALVGIEPLARRTVTSLSDGERQKVMIAKALAQQTPVVLLDEPTAFLDYPSKVDMMLLLRRLARDERKAVLLSTHDLELALQTADRLWLLSPTAELEGEAGASYGANPSMHSSNPSSHSAASSFPAPATLVGGTPRALADGGQIASFVNRDSMVFDADTMSVRLKPMP